MKSQDLKNYLGLVLTLCTLLVALLSGFAWHQFLTFAEKDSLSDLKEWQQKESIDYFTSEKNKLYQQMKERFPGSVGTDQNGEPFLTRFKGIDFDRSYLRNKIFKTELVISSKRRAERYRQKQKSSEPVKIGFVAGLVFFGFMKLLIVLFRIIRKANNSLRGKHNLPSQTANHAAGDL